MPQMTLTAEIQRTNGTAFRPNPRRVVPRIFPFAFKTWIEAKQVKNGEIADIPRAKFMAESKLKFR